MILVCLVSNVLDGILPSQTGTLTTFCCLWYRTVDRLQTAGYVAVSFSRRRSAPASNIKRAIPGWAASESFLNTGRLREIKSRGFGLCCLPVSVPSACHLAREPLTKQHAGQYSAAEHCRPIVASEKGEDSPLYGLWHVYAAGSIYGEREVVEIIAQILWRLKSPRRTSIRKSRSLQRTEIYPVNTTEMSRQLPFPEYLSIGR